MADCAKCYPLSKRNGNVVDFPICKLHTFGENQENVIMKEYSANLDLEGIKGYEDNARGS